MSFTVTLKGDKMSKQIKLGMKLRDAITGLVGIAVARTEWIHGCVRWTIQPQEIKDGKPVDNYTVDEPQLEIVEPTESKQQATGGPIPSPKQHSGPTR